MKAIINQETTKDFSWINTLRTDYGTCCIQIMYTLHTYYGTLCTDYVTRTWVHNAPVTKSWVPEVAEFHLSVGFQIPGPRLPCYI